MKCQTFTIFKVLEINFIETFYHLNIIVKEVIWQLDHSRMSKIFQKYRPNYTGDKVDVH